MFDSPALEDADTVKTFSVAVFTEGQHIRNGAGLLLAPEKKTNTSSLPPE